jgi:hypothetical protein
MGFFYATKSLLIFKPVKFTANPSSQYKFIWPQRASPTVRKLDTPKKVLPKKYIKSDQLNILKVLKKSIRYHLLAAIKIEFS